MPVLVKVAQCPFCDRIMMFPHAKDRIYAPVESNIKLNATCAACFYLVSRIRINPFYCNA
jgi:hypothetical protein